MKAKKRIKELLRPIRSVFLVVIWSHYEIARYIAYGGAWRRANAVKRNYRAVKIYHRLEKSLAFKEQKPLSGMDAAEDLVDFLKTNKNGYSFHEERGINVLSQFQKRRQSNKSIDKFIECNHQYIDDGVIVGAIAMNADTLRRGMLDDPELFFYSRHSVRSFSSKPVDEELLDRAIRLASKTPSVCNRQSWIVYRATDRETINAALRYQNGNRGFGHEVQCLLIIAADLAAFDTPNERYQYWIDGGMYAMSLVYSFHALGVSSCCLNWSQTPKADRQLRRAIGIERNHSVVMLLAVGYPSEELLVCASPRTPPPVYIKDIKV